MYKKMKIIIRLELLVTFILIGILMTKVERSFFDIGMFVVFAFILAFSVWIISMETLTGIALKKKQMKGVDIMPKKYHMIMGICFVMYIGVHILLLFKDSIVTSDFNMLIFYPMYLFFFSGRGVYAFDDQLMVNHRVYPLRSISHYEVKKKSFKNEVSIFRMNEKKHVIHVFDNQIDEVTAFLDTLNIKRN